MHFNENTAISTSKVLLVPYEAHHVPTYHEWMKDPEIQALTASEPLSLEEEYAMQKSWRKDRDKLTFIICLPLPDPPSAPVTIENSTNPVILTTSTTPSSSTKQPSSSSATSSLPLTPTTDLNPTPQMIGDINLFLSPSDEESTTSTSPTCTGEIELMIAPLAARKKGYGRAALLTFLRYIFIYLDDILEEYSSDSNTNADVNIYRESSKSKPVDIVKQSGNMFQLKKLRVKIDKENVASIKLFQSIGFVLVDGGQVNYFGEVEGALVVGGESGLDAAGKAIEDLMGKWGVEEWKEIDYSHLSGEGSV